MILKNKTSKSTILISILGLRPTYFFSIEKKLGQKARFHFSSLYQSANFSSSSVGPGTNTLAKSMAGATTNTSSVAKAISNKASVSATPSLTSAGLPYQKNNLLFFGFQSLAANAAITNKKLLNYNFLANSKKTSPLAAKAGASTTNFLKTNTALTPLANATIVYSEDIIKLISAFFKSIYCLISRPKFINTPDKIIIEILYYITIPDHNVFKWYNFIYNKAATTSKSSILTKNNKILNIKKKPTIKTILFKNFLIKKTLFKLNNTNIVNLYINKFNILFKLLQGQYLPNICAAQIINKPIEFNLIRLHKSDYDSNILAQLFILILKKKNIRIAINKLYTKNNIADTAIANYYKQNQASSPDLKGWGIGREYNFIPAYISGLYIKIGGRLMREPIIPRITTKKFEIGAIATGKVNLVDSARITKKNKKGAFTIKITYAQNFVSLA